MKYTSVSLPLSIFFLQQNAAVVASSCIGDITELKFNEFAGVEKCVWKNTIKRRIKTIMDDIPACGGTKVLSVARGLTGEQNKEAAITMIEEKCKEIVESDPTAPTVAPVPTAPTSDSGSCTTIEELEEINGCDYETFKTAVSENQRNDCPHNIERELEILTGTNSDDDAKDAINRMCTAAWEKVDKSAFTDISGVFDDEFMADYVNGEGFLNTETGNFQGRRQTDTTSPSYLAGQAIKEYHDSQAANSASNSRLIDTNTFENCELQTIMCCFGRDRQFGDNNGNCARNDCEDADPGDNSNLCYTEPSNTPYPKDAEGDVHCHGLAWAEDENDFISQLKFNNFFFVSLYDHMYSRGYVQNMIYDQPGNTDNVPMCSCIENMHPVSRSDCTQIDAEQTFEFSINNEGELQAEPQGDLEVEFNACKGIKYGTPNKGQDNDLASYVVRLVQEEKMTTVTQDAVYDILLGYESPGSNANENVCKASYEAKTGEQYPRN